jgi:hypothetical protein
LQWVLLRVRDCEEGGEGGRRRRSLPNKHANHGDEVRAGCCCHDWRFCERAAGIIGAFLGVLLL